MEGAQVKPRPRPPWIQTQLDQGYRPYSFYVEYQRTTPLARVNSSRPPVSAVPALADGAMAHPTPNPARTQTHSHHTHNGTGPLVTHTPHPLTDDLVQPKGSTYIGHTLGHNDSGTTDMSTGTGVSQPINGSDHIVNDHFMGRSNHTDIDTEMDNTAENIVSSPTPPDGDSLTEDVPSMVGVTEGGMVTPSTTNMVVHPPTNMPTHTAPKTLPPLHPNISGSSPAGKTHPKSPRTEPITSPVVSPTTVKRQGLLPWLRPTIPWVASTPAYQVGDQDSDSAKKKKVPTATLR